MSTTLNIPVNVPQGFNMNLLVAQLTEYAKTLIAASSSTAKGKKHYKHEALSGIFEPTITEADLVIDPVVDSMFKDVPPLSADVDVKKEYGEYLYEKYK